MLERINPFRNQKEESTPSHHEEPASHEVTPEEMAIKIETQVISRSSLSPEQWIERYGAKYRELWDANHSQFLELNRENPEELYGLINQYLETEGS